MAATKVKENHDWFAKFLKSDPARDIVKPAAERVLESARAGAPVDSGAYRAGLHLDEATTDRVVERVATGVPYGLDVEARHNTLRNALDAI
jgi:hypothetical protein